MFVPYSGVRVSMPGGWRTGWLIRAFSSTGRTVMMRLLATDLLRRLARLRALVTCAVLSEPSEGLLGQAGALARERCLAGPASAVVVDMPVQLRPRKGQQPGDLRGEQVSIRGVPARGSRPDSAGCG